MGIDDFRGDFPGVEIIVVDSPLALVSRLVSDPCFTFDVSSKIATHISESSGIAVQIAVSSIYNLEVL
jgi:hypothetical protein